MAEITEVQSDPRGRGYTEGLTLAPFETKKAGPERTRLKLLKSGRLSVIVMMGVRNALLANQVVQLAG
jgi:hypothetical protein